MVHVFELEDQGIAAAFLLLTELTWAMPLQRAQRGQWVCQIPLKPGRYAYRVIAYRDDLQPGTAIAPAIPMPILSTQEQVLEVVDAAHVPADATRRDFAGGRTSFPKS